jgi:hypothetical protein
MRRAELGAARSAQLALARSGASLALARFGASLALVMLAVSCEATSSTRSRDGVGQPARVEAHGSAREQNVNTPARTFGDAPKLAGAPLDVEQVLAAPKTYLQQTIKCRGKVSRVCEAAGCWLELRADAGGPGLRVPMAGHSFFVPQDIVGKQAIVEGALSSRVLSDSELAHLRGEGLSAIGPLFLAATSVVVASDDGEQSGLIPSEHRERSRFR